MHVLGARVGRVDPPGVRARVPVVDRGVVLDARDRRSARRPRRSRPSARGRRRCRPARRSRARSSATPRRARPRRGTPRVTRTELFAFWYWIEWKPSPSIDMSKPASRSAAALSSSRALHQMKSRMSGWSTSSTTILAARRVLPPDLIVPAQASAPRMNETGPGGEAALGELLLGGADLREVDARARSRRGRSCPPWCSSPGSTPSCPRPRG